MSFIAKFENDCDNCEEPVKVGEEAKMINYDKGIIAHVKCPTPTEPMIEVICSKCFLIHAGECF